MYKFAAYLKTVEEAVVESCSKIAYMDTYQRLYGQLPEVQQAARNNNSDIAAKTALNVQNAAVVKLQEYLSGLLPKGAPAFSHLYKEHYNLFMDYYESLMTLYRMYTVETDHVAVVNGKLTHSMLAYTEPEHPLYDVLFEYHTILVKRIMAIPYSKRKN